jgi:chemotaxis protein MotA
MDPRSLIGFVVALLAIVGGQLLEGGHLSSILQPTAALIVLGGTLGAVALQFPPAALRQALDDLRQALRPSEPLGPLIATLSALAHRARREGIVALEREAAQLPDPFLRRALELAIDGFDPAAVRRMLELQLDKVEEEADQSVKVLEAAGGYAPTVGILGAVLGLIHVMENLSEPARLGSGIAVAFVATVYGVGSANLLFLPLAGKLKLRAREVALRLEIIIEGVCSLAEGENPRTLERRLSVYAAERRAGTPRPSATVKAGRVRGAA